MLFDIGIGILSGLATGKVFGAPFLIFALLGVVFSLVMDGDAVIDLIIHGGTGHSYKHRDLFHRPFAYIPAGMVIMGVALYAASPAYLIGIQYVVPIVILFVVCSLAHFLHDSIGIGWGVQWLWPFSTDHFSFLYQYNVRKKGLPARLPFRLVYVWKDADIDRLEAAYGDKGWFRNIYLSLHPYGLIELAVFLVAIAVAYILSR